MLVAFVIPLGILRNGFRIMVIGLLCIHIGPQMDRIHEDEITEVLISNQALLEFMRLPSPR